MNLLQIKTDVPKVESDIVISCLHKLDIPGHRL